MKEAIVIERVDFENIAQKFFKELILSHRFIVEKPMTREQIADFLQYSTKHIDKLVSMGIIKAHRMHDGASPRFLPSEVLEALKMR